MTFYSVKLGVELQAPSLFHRRFTSPVQYPSAWFAKHPHSKPMITLHPEEATRLFGEVTGMIQANNWNDLIVSSYMAGVIRENPDLFEMQLTEDWSSMERTIGTTNESITPLSLLSIEDAPQLPAVQNPPASTKEYRKSLFFALLLVYSKALAKSTYGTYRGNVGRILNEFSSKIMGLNANDINKLAAAISEYEFTPNYRKIIAAIDMFFFYFPSAPYAAIRMATRPARYRGCAAWTSLCEVASALKLKATELAQFVLTDYVGKDLLWITKDEGAEDVKGYFPYQLEFGLTAMSPYSMSRNRNLYIWIHTIGAMLGLQRSINAEFRECGSDVIWPFVNAIAVAYHLGQGENWKRQSTGVENRSVEYRERYAAHQKRVNEAPQEEEDEIEHSEIEKRVKYVLRQLQVYDGLSPEQIAAVKIKTAGFRATPVCTIGAYLRKLYPPGY